MARDLAARQVEYDDERTREFPQLLRRKMERMSASPLAFLRGAAPLFYEILKENPDLAEGPPGEGWIVGDLHIENFGAYRPDGFNSDEKEQAHHPAVFDLNDFDDTIEGPWRFDVLRFSTSLLLAGRELGVTGPVVLDLLDRVLEAWAHAAFDGKTPGAPPSCVAHLVEGVRSRARSALLDARTKESGGKRKFVRGDRYTDLDPKVLEALPDAFAEYISTLKKDEQPHKSALAIQDAAFRVAGTGSLGGLRIAVLVEGKGGSHGQWIFDLKEQGTPSASTLLGDPKLEPAERVVTGYRACLVHPPSVLGMTHLKSGKSKLSMTGRRLSPQEDKLDLPALAAADLPDLATHLGTLLGAAHARGGNKKHATRWSKSDRDTVRQQAIALAGIHEATYIALCERMRTL